MTTLASMSAPTGTITPVAPALDTVVATPLRPVIAGPLAGVDPARLAADDTMVALGNPDVVRRYWVPDGTGVNPYGFVGEDARMSAAVRFVNRYAPHAMITVHFHVVDLRERSSNHPAVHPTPFIVEEVIEYLIAEHPIADGGIGEAWSDMTFAYTNGRQSTEAEATAVRDEMAAQQAALGIGERFYWNGTPQ